MSKVIQITKEEVKTYIDQLPGSIYKRICEYDPQGKHKNTESFPQKWLYGLIEDMDTFYTSKGYKFAENTIEFNMAYLIYEAPRDRGGKDEEVEIVEEKEIEIDDLVEDEEIQLDDLVEDKPKQMTV